MNGRLVILLANIGNALTLSLIYKLLGFEVAVIVGLVMVMAYLVYTAVEEKEK